MCFYLGFGEVHYTLQRILTLFSKAIIYQEGYGSTHSTLPFVPKKKKICCRSVLSQLLSNKEYVNFHNLKIMENRIISSKGLDKTYPKRTKTVPPDRSTELKLLSSHMSFPQSIQTHHRTSLNANCDISYLLSVLTFSPQSSSENLLLKRKWFKMYKHLNFQLNFIYNSALQ